MKTPKFTICIIALILLIQFAVGLSLLCKSKNFVSDDTLKTLEIPTAIPYSFSDDNSLSIREDLKMLYSEDEPIERMKFKVDDNIKLANASNHSHFSETQIYLILKEEGDKLHIDGYSISKPKDSLFLKAKTSHASKNNKGIISLDVYVQNLDRFYIEGDKYKAVRKYLDKVSSFNREIDRNLSRKELTKEEAEAQRKKAYVVLAVGDNGNFYVKDYIVDNKSITNDFPLKKNKE